MSVIPTFLFFLVFQFTFMIRCSIADDKKLAAAVGKLANEKNAKTREYKIEYWGARASGRKRQEDTHKKVVRAVPSSPKGVQRHNRPEADCIKTPCKNDGTCEKTFEGNICRCKEGFTGLYCEETMMEEEGSGDKMAVMAAAVCTIIIVLVLVTMLLFFYCFVRQERIKLMRQYQSALDLRQDVPELEWKHVALRVVQQQAECCPFCRGSDPDEDPEKALLLSTIEHHDQEYELKDDIISNYSQQGRRSSTKSQQSATRSRTGSLASRAPSASRSASRSQTGSPRHSKGSVYSQTSHRRMSGTDSPRRSSVSHPPPLHPTEPPEMLTQSDTE